MNTATTTARVNDETINRLRAARREYGEQCPAAQRLREILPLTAPAR